MDIVHELRCGLHVSGVPCAVESRASARLVRFHPSAGIERRVADARLTLAKPKPATSRSHSAKQFPAP
jgi:hypothetical protein